MIGAEFVRERSPRAPWGDGAKATRAALFSRGVLMHTCGAWDQVLRFMSPLVIEDELLERGLNAFEDAVESLDSIPGGTGAKPAAAVRAGLAEPHLPASPGGIAPVPPPVPGRTIPTSRTS